ncbi:MAG TPA: malto-oligosyltrehalose trehalohydrolase [Bryobacteraceae bacterium]|nr:malto-oligosyltrehalose trehalohydrolase [Bryobacteraceae bacterium]
MVANLTSLIGAEMLKEGGAAFRVWAPHRERAQVILESGPGAPAEVELQLEDGFFSATVAGAAEGTLYRFRLNGESLYADPASRFQPHGPDGPSELIDARKFPWTDAEWDGVQPPGQVIYELHVGTFTEEGTWESARRELPELAKAGISVVEIMPIADFPGRFGWGYDGVHLFAPTWLYGRPDDMRRFVDDAHRVGIGVILDVVYNHVGPEGNHLKEFSPDYFTDAYRNEWGEAINFDGPNSGPVREYFIANAAYWIRDFHLDGLRLDATQQIFDKSGEHIVAALVKAAHEAAGARKIFMVAENEPQDTRLVRPPSANGYGVDALWNDDFHHSAMVAMTGRNEAYYTDYLGRPQEFISAVKHGYLFQGQRYKWQKQRRGTPTRGLTPLHFVNYIQNHDQVANSTAGLRAHMLTSPGRYRAMTALLLLAPGTPMLFQGEEFASSKPFYYFADHNPELAKVVQKGRSEFLSQFRSMANKETYEALPDPGNPNTFQKCKLDSSERERHAHSYNLHKDLIRLRRQDAVFCTQGRNGLDGAVLADEAFVLRFFGEDCEDRLLIVNLGRDLLLDPAPEPLLAPPDGRQWNLLWSSEDIRYGGTGSYSPDTEENWRIPGHAAVVVAPAPLDAPLEDRTDA